MKSLLALYSLLLLFLGTSFHAAAQCCTDRDRGYCQKFAQTHLRLGATAHGIGGTADVSMGTTLGLVHEWHLLPFFQLRGEANAVWQGSSDHFWSRSDADYFSVNAPLLLQFRLSPGWYAAGGVGVSYLVHAHGGPLPTERLGLDWVGVLHYRFCCSRVGLELRYQYRIGSSATAAPDASTGVPPFNPSSLQAALTVRF